MITSHTFEYGDHMTIKYGAYTQIHDDTDNIMKLQMTGTITLHPMKNQQSFFILSPYKVAYVSRQEYG